MDFGEHLSAIVEKEYLQYSKWYKEALQRHLIDSGLDAEAVTKAIASFQPVAKSSYDTTNNEYIVIRGYSKSAHLILCSPSDLQSALGGQLPAYIKKPQRKLDWGEGLYITPMAHLDECLELFKTKRIKNKVVAKSAYAKIRQANAAGVK